MISLREWILYTIVKFFSLTFMALPLRIALFLGKISGLLAYYLDIKHKNLAYTHIKLALSKELGSPKKIREITKRLFMNLGMNLSETLRLPKIDKNYIKKYIRIEGEEFLKEALKNQRGVIVFGSHFGSWELFFATVSLLGYRASIFTREQYRFNSLNELLNSWRKSKGCRVLIVGEDTKEAIKRLKSNEIVGLVSDHGGREGIPIEFFGRKALTPTGVIRFAHLLDTPILPIYIVRIKGPYHKIKILSPLLLEETGDEEKDLIANLERINRILEEYIKEYPVQYHWFYKRWKYSQQKDLLILSDSKAGHLRQLESLVKMMKEISEEKKFEVRIKKVEVKFKNRFMKGFQYLCTALASRYHCRGCLWCLRRTLDRSSYEELERIFADIVISCGSSTAYINFVISSELKAKSIHIMRPGLLSTKRFDLVIMPEHDCPPKRRNVIVTLGSLNLVDDRYLKEESEKLLQTTNYKLQTTKLKIGLLIGGDTKDFRLSKESMIILIKELKKLIYDLDANILITTSRRTSKEIELLIKREFLNESRCNLLVIANEKNLDFAVGGILGLSDMVIVSPESISMISEAASSGKYVIVFKQEGIPKRKGLFLKILEESGYIRVVNVDEIYAETKDILEKKPQVKRLDDHSKVLEAVRKILT